jgi:hypothetical protein
MSCVTLFKENSWKPEKPRQAREANIKPDFRNVICVLV